MFLSIDEIVQATGGKVLSARPQESSLKGFSIDTREESLEGKIFIALKGERFDGHNFLNEAKQKKASAFLVSQEVDLSDIPSPVIKVSDTLKAFQSLASFYRKKCQFRVIAVTGSVGKTSTKNFTYDILSRYKKTFTVKKSFNNHVGVPLTLLKAHPSDEVIVLEIGSNHPGEIAHLCELAAPDQVLVTKIAHSHMEFFKTLEGVAKEKQDLYLKAPTHALQIFNLDQEWLRDMHFQAQDKYRKCLTYSHIFSNVDVHFTVKEFSTGGMTLSGHIQNHKEQVFVPVFGLHNLNNLMAAACFALGEGLSSKDIWRSLSVCKNPWGRSQVSVLENNITVLFDAYNSSLESTQALLENIKRLHWTSGNKYLILGEINEAGEKKEFFYKTLLDFLKEQKWKKVWFVGPSSDFFQKHKSDLLNLKIFHEEEPKMTEQTCHNLTEDLLQNLKKGDLLAFKASRSLQLERVVETLKKKVT